MTNEIEALIQFYRELVESEFSGCASFDKRMIIADRAEKQIKHMKMRLAQIASGDFRVCGASAEETARDALRSQSYGDQIDWKQVSAICL